MSTTPTWARPARALADYVAQASRLPRQSGADNDVEKQAGNILRAFRRKAATGALEDDLAAWLDQNIAGWRTDNVRPAATGMRGRRNFSDRVAAVKRFRDRHHHLPSSTSSSPKERELGRFLANHRLAAKGSGTTKWTPSKRRTLDRVVPGWSTPRAGVPHLPPGTFIAVAGV